MVQRAWNGEDMTMSATALSQAVDAMAESVENYIRENASPDVTGGADAPDETETSPPEITELSEPDTSSMRYIFDLAGCLSSDSRTKLEARAEEISTRHSCGVYVAFVDDYIRCTAKEATSTRGPIGSTTISSSAWGMGVTA